MKPGNKQYLPHSAIIVQFVGEKHFDDGRRALAVFVDLSGVEYTSDLATLPGSDPVSGDRYGIDGDTIYSLA